MLSLPHRLSAADRPSCLLQADLCELAKGPVLPWNNQGPPLRAYGPGALSFCACPAWPHSSFLSVSLQVPRGRDWAWRQLPSPNPEGTRKALVTPQTFCSKAGKSPAHALGMHSSCNPSPARGLWRGRAQKGQPSLGRGGGPLGNQATRAGRALPPLAPVCIPCEPLLENESKGAVGLDHDKPPCPSESTLCLP